MLPEKRRMEQGICLQAEEEKKSEN